MELNDSIKFGEKEYIVVEDLVGKNEKQRKTTFRVGFVTILLFVVVFVLGFIAIRMLHYPTCVSITVWLFLAIIGSYVLYTVLHEAIRAVVFMIAGGVMHKDLLFGAVWKAGTVYCISKVPVGIWRSRIAVLMPFLLVSLPLLVYSVAVGNVIYLIASSLLLTINGRDFWYLWKLRKSAKGRYLFEEKPEAGTQEPQGYILKEIS